jgi:hypothetical protein
MGSAVEERTRHFYSWERRGRGWTSYPYPVALEPSLASFRHLSRTTSVVDDARHHTALSGLLEWLFRKEQVQPPAPEPPVEESAPEPADEDGQRIELKLLLPKNLAVTPALSEATLKSIAALRTPVSFELLGSGGRVSVIFTAPRDDIPLLSSQVRAFFPNVILEERPDVLLREWEGAEPGLFSALELGLAREFMVPLDRPRSFAPDPLTALVGALAEAGPGEMAIVQVLIQGVTAPWAESVVWSVTTPSGDPFFADAPEITSLAREKVSAPLFAVVLRLVARAASGRDPPAPGGGRLSQGAAARQYGDSGRGTIPL